MSRHIRQAAAALVLLAVAGCSGGSGGTPADGDGPSLLRVGSAVLRDTVSARKAPAAAAAAPTRRPWRPRRWLPIPGR